MKGDITIDLIDIKIEIREYYKQFYAYTFNSLDKKDKFLKTHKLPKLT